MEDQNYQLSQQYGALEAESDKHKRELGRLRAHLLQVEEQHTQETLQSDEREQQLQQALKNMEDMLNKNTILASQQRYAHTHVR